MATSPKVTVATVAAAITTLILWAVATYVPGVDLPEAAQGAVLVIVTALVTFAGGWRKTDPARHDPAADTGHGAKR